MERANTRMHQAESWDNDLEYLIKNIIDSVVELSWASEEAIKVLQYNLNYLNHNADALSGDDCIGDGKLTQQYNNRLAETEKHLNRVFEAKRDTDIRLKKILGELK